MMSQRALNPHPVSTTPRAWWQLSLYRRLLSCIVFVLSPLKHVEGQTISYNRKLNGSPFPEGGKQRAKPAFRGAMQCYGWASWHKLFKMPAICNIPIQISKMKLFKSVVNMANDDWIFGNKVIRNFAVSWRSGYGATRWCKSRTNSTQSVTRPYYFSGSLSGRMQLLFFSHPHGSFKTLPSRTICACVGDAWWPVVWYRSCSGAGKSFCLSLRGDSWQSHGHAKQHLLAHVWATQLLM